MGMSGSAFFQRGAEVLTAANRRGAAGLEGAGLNASPSQNGSIRSLWRDSLVLIGNLVEFGKSCRILRFIA
jgi:hypothetical protein